MKRSPYVLAALASVAVPGLDVRGVRRLGSPGDYDVAEVTGADGARFDIRVPRSDSAGAALEAELGLLIALDAHHANGDLPFAVPQVVGKTLLPDGGHAVVTRYIAATPLRPESMGPEMAANLGRALGAIHELPVSTIEAVGLPSYSAENYRQRRLAELDEVAQTGKVPASLLRRWEQALEDVALWRFRPVPVHGELGADQVLVDGSQVVAITDWWGARVADPADDLAWVLVAAPLEVADTIITAYLARRGNPLDLRLTDRAALISELALTRWLLHGVRNDAPDVIADAEAMLADLSAAIAQPVVQPTPAAGVASAEPVETSSP